MKKTVKLAKIGSSRGIRLSKQLLEHYQIGDTLELETTPDAINLRASESSQLSWNETYQQMAKEAGDWSEWDAVAEDGLEDED